jgi:hypothetical protein
MMQFMAAASFCGQKLEGTYSCTGERLVLQSRFGRAECRTGGIPDKALAAMMLVEQARTARLSEVHGND